MNIFGENGLGDVGIVKDKLPHETPQNAWSDGQNVRFADGYVEKTLGYKQVFGTPSITPYALFPAVAANKYNWIYAGLQKVYVYDGTSHINLTRQTAGVDVNYTGTADNQWTGGVIGGVPVLNNGVDAPQMWLPVQTSQRLQLLTNWPGNTVCEVMRVYKSFLVALNVSKNGVRYPQMVKWSHPADPFTVPSSWSETDPTKDAGEYTLSDTGDWLVDCLPLRDGNVLYKENTTWGMQFIGGVDIFRFTKLFGSFGALGKNCAVEFLTGKHLVLTQGDVVVHDGQSADSVVQGKWRKWISSNINQAAAQKAFIVANTVREEAWICLPINGASFPNVALIWNWRSGAVGLRDLPTCPSLALGIVNETVTDETWDADSATWDSDTSVWGEKLFKTAEGSLLMASQTDTKLYKADLTTDANGVAQVSFVEKTGIGIPLKQGLPPDFTSYKFIQNVWPRIDGTAGAVVQVAVGTQNEIGGAVTWQPSVDYTIGSTQKIDVFASGRLLALRVSSSGSLSWRLHGAEVDVENGGNF